MQEEKREEMESNIDIKGTLAKFVKADEPELSQEEAILKYGETKKKSANASEDTAGENTEEQEHINRVKKELLASLERVKALAKRIYGENKQEKTKKELKVENGGRQAQKEEKEEMKQVQKEDKQQERE